MSDLVVAKVEATGEDEEPGEGGAKTPPKLTDLPEELLLYLATFLNGRDVVHLSHVNQVRALLRIWVKCCLTWIVLPSTYGEVVKASFCVCIEPQVVLWLPVKASFCVIFS